MNRQRAGRGATSRDSSKAGSEVDVEAIKAQVREGMIKAQEYNDKARDIALQIIALERDFEAKSSRPGPAEKDKLDVLYRDLYKATEAEKAVLHEEPYDLQNKLAILQVFSASRMNEESQSRGGILNKPRKQQRAGADADVIAESPGPSPNESRTDVLKRVKGMGSRSSSVPGSGRTGAPVKSEDDGAIQKGARAEREGQFVVGAEVFYRHPKGAVNEEGEGIQCIIKKVYTDRKPIQYDVQDPEPDDNGRQDLHKAVATDLIPIPKSGSHLPVFSVGKQVLARYPDTTTFYKAEVMSFRKDVYNLRFEDDDREMEVDKRFVLDLRMK